VKFGENRGTKQGTLRIRVILDLRAAGASGRRATGDAVRRGVGSVGPRWSPGRRKPERRRRKLRGKEASRAVYGQGHMEENREEKKETKEKNR
jgi:hypothetical protein